MALILLNMIISLGVMGGPPGDLCADAEAITGEGVFAFDNRGATTDGNPYDGCEDLTFQTTEIANDVWFCWTAPCDGRVTVDTCGGTTVDTQIGVFEGCDCPTANLVDCTDDPCVYQSRVTFTAEAGQSYLLRLGTSPFVSGGEGTFTITCGAVFEPLCAAPEENCQRGERWNARASDGSEYAVADVFRPAADVQIQEICWWGTYFDGAADCQATAADAFEVRYYSDADGVPGVLVAGPFRQADGTLSVDGPVRTYELITDAHHEYEYHAIHAPVSVPASDCYWIEITNGLGAGCTWFWEVSQAGGGRAAQDGGDGLAPDGYDRFDLLSEEMAFCLDVALDAAEICRPVPVNDNGLDALPIFEGETLFDTTNAEAVNYRPYYPGCYPGADWCCDLPFDDHSIYRDVWFDYTASCSALLEVDICDALFDTKLAVYEGGSGRASPCNDDGCGDGLVYQSRISMPVAQGRLYTLRVGGYRNVGPIPPGISDCYIAADPEQRGCNDRQCEAFVCAVDPLCCDKEWDWRCEDRARNGCYGQGGPGSIYLELVAPPPADETLADFAEFLPCFTDACSDPPCDPPIYADECCLVNDFDSDGDVDLEDYENFRKALIGP